MSDDTTQRNIRIPANARREYHITAKDLPLCCPMPDMELWNSHPRVYLDLNPVTGHARCPYCSAEYILDQSGGLAA